MRKGQAIPAQAPYSPGVAGHDPDFRTSANEYSVAKARALLNMYGERLAKTLKERSIVGTAAARVQDQVAAAA